MSERASPLAGDERRRLWSISRGRVPSPRDPALHVLLARGLVDSGRDGFFVTELGHEALAGRYPVREPGLPLWLFSVLVVVLGVGLWRLAGGDFRAALLGFSLAALVAQSLDLAMVWLRRRRRADRPTSGSAQHWARRSPSQP